MLKTKIQDEAFSDGIVKLHRKENVTAAGDLPKAELVHQLTLRYRRRTVGIKRYYTALQNQQHIDEVIRCPLVSSVSVLDIAELQDGGKYLIRQIQYPEGTAVAVMDLALEKLEAGYEIN